MQAESGEDALQRISDFAFDAIITDLRLPGIDGTQVIQKSIELYPDIVGVEVTGFGTVRDAVEAIKHGARLISVHPFTSDMTYRGACEMAAPFFRACKRCGF